MLLQHLAQIFSLSGGQKHQHYLCIIVLHSHPLMVGRNLVSGLCVRRKNKTVDCPFSRCFPMSFRCFSKLRLTLQI